MKTACLRCECRVWFGSQFVHFHFGFLHQLLSLQVLILS